MGVDHLLGHQGVLSNDARYLVAWHRLPLAVKEAKTRALEVLTVILLIDPMKG